MKTLMIGAALGLGMMAHAASASTFMGYELAGAAYFDGSATLDYDPIFMGLAMSDDVGDLDVALETDLASGYLTLLDPSGPVLDGSLIATAFESDGGLLDDTFSMLFELTVGATPYAIATFIGDLDGGGTVDFLTEGALFASGTATITGAVAAETPVIPLPASLPLLIGGFGALGLASRRRRKAG